MRLAAGALLVAASLAFPLTVRAAELRAEAISEASYGAPYLVAQPLYARGRARARSMMTIGPLTSFSQ